MSADKPVSLEPQSGRARVAQPRHRARRWIPYAGAVLLLALIVAGLWPEPVPVETALAQSGTLRATVNEEGKTRIREKFLVSAPVAGQLRRIELKAGAAVKAGEPVAWVDAVSPALLDPRSLALAEARRDAAVAQAAKARAAHGFAISELRRFEKLFADKTISPQEFEKAQWRETEAARELAAAESALREAEAQLSQFNLPASSTNASSQAPVMVRAPAAGQVLRVVEESARVVSSGEALLEIGDPADLEVVIEVLSRDGAIIRPGTPVELEQWGGGEVLQAKVRLVEPAAFTKVSALGVEEQRVNVIADFVTPPAGRASLGDQFRVEAGIIVWQADQVLKVPAGALFRRGERWAVFIVQDGRAEQRLVEVGRSSGMETQILQGLQSGERVILYPGDRVRPGQRVRQITL